MVSPLNPLQRLGPNPREPEPSCSLLVPQWEVRRVHLAAVLSFQLQWGTTELWVCRQALMVQPPKGINANEVPGVGCNNLIST